MVKDRMVPVLLPAAATMSKFDSTVVSSIEDVEDALAVT